jgi:hypothetical protein
LRIFPALPKKSVERRIAAGRLRNDKDTTLPRHAATDVDRAKYA